MSESLAPETVLAEVGALRRRARADRHACWLPLLVLERSRGLLAVAVLYSAAAVLAKTYTVDNVGAGFWGASDPGTCSCRRSCCRPRSCSPAASRPASGRRWPAGGRRDGARAPGPRARRPGPPTAPLGILAVAAEARRVDFGYLQAQLDLTAGNLSRHISVLSDAGLVEVEKG